MTEPDAALERTQREMDEALLAIVKAHNCDDACKPLFGKLCAALKRRDAAVRLDAVMKTAATARAKTGAMWDVMNAARRAYEEASNGKE